MIARALAALAAALLLGRAEAQCPTTPPPPGAAALTWVPPTQNTDNTPLTDLAGYRILWGTALGNYPNSRILEGPGLQAYCLTGLTTATWFFVVTARDVSGNESVFSNPATKTVVVPTPPSAPTDITMTPTAPAAFVTVLGTRQAFIGDTFTLSTPTVANTRWYEWQIQQQENRVTFALNGRIVTWTATRSGHHIPRVRACNDDGCSAWLDSVSRGWWTFYWLRAPSF